MVTRTFTKTTYKVFVAPEIAGNAPEQAEVVLWGNGRGKEENRIKKVCPNFLMIISKDTEDVLLGMTEQTFIDNAHPVTRPGNKADSEEE